MVKCVYCGVFVVFCRELSGFDFFTWGIFTQKTHDPTIFIHALQTTQKIETHKYASERKAFTFSTTTADMNGVCVMMFVVVVDCVVAMRLRITRDHAHIYTHSYVRYYRQHHYTNRAVTHHNRTYRKHQHTCIPCIARCCLLECMCVCVV